MFVLGIAGRRKSGKDTAGVIVEKAAARSQYLAKREGFADKLKESGIRSLYGQHAPKGLGDILALANALKDTGKIVVTIPGAEPETQTMTGREFWQWYGTEGHRDVFWDDFWVDALLPEGQDNLERRWGMVEQGLDSALRIPDLAIITDVRFPNEAERIRSIGGVIWRINRPGLPEEKHASETPLPDHLVDLEIDNDSTLEAFQAKGLERSNDLMVVSVQPDYEKSKR